MGNRMRQKRTSKIVRTLKTQNILFPDPPPDMYEAFDIEDSEIILEYREQRPIYGDDSGKQ